MIINKLEKAGVIHPPKFLANNTIYLTIMGSMAYGIATDSSDIDIYGICMPPLTNIFSHLDGEIEDFGTRKPRFNQWQEHRVKSPDSDKEYDFTVFNIVKFFNLAMENNPNVIDALFTPRNCILHSTSVGEIIRDNRRIFLHKGSWHRFRGYAYSQMHKIDNKHNALNPKRAETIKQFGFDTKFGTHLVRLLLEVEQILIEGDIDLQRHNDVLKSIRRGEWTLPYLKDWFQEKEKSLETIYATSTLQNKPDEEAIKSLLLGCIEHHYGSLDHAIKIPNKEDRLLQDLQALVAKYQ